MGRNGQMERAISIGPVQPRKEVHLEKWTALSKLFRLDLTDPFSFRPKVPEILVEWIALINEGSSSYLYHHVQHTIL